MLARTWQWLAVVAVVAAVAGPASAQVRIERGDDGTLRIETVQGDGAYLGVRIEDLPADMAEEAGVREGALVTEVTDGSPALKAGLRTGDVIIALDDQRVESAKGLVEAVQAHEPGDRVRVTYRREGTRRTVMVELGRHLLTPPWPPEAPLHRRDALRRERRDAERDEPEPEEAAGGGAYLGAIVAELEPAMKEIAGTDAGVLLSTVMNGSPADEAGLMAGDVVTEIDGKAVTGPEQLIEVIRGHAPGDRVRVTYYRLGNKGAARVRLGDRGAVDRPETPEEGGPFGPQLDSVPWLKDYLEEMQPQLREWMEQLRKHQRTPEGEAPFVAPPERPRVPAPKGGQPSYELSKDIGRILERLERMERRLDEIEERLDALEQ